MKKLLLIHGLTTLLLLAVPAVQAQDAGSTPPATQREDGSRLHTIKAGETLYSLTKRYGVTAEAICKANPGLSATNFKAGTVILIPKADEVVAAIVKADTVKTEAVEQPQGVAGSNCREMHKVKRKETLFSIAQKYGISLAELQDANPETKAPGYALKRKDVLCIPYPKKEVEQPKETVPTDEELFQKARPASGGMEKIRLGVVMPFKDGTATAQRTLDFYRGLLMAVDSLKHRGTSFEVYAFDAGRTAADIEKVTSRPIFADLDIVFGPTDPTQIKAVSRVTKAAGTPLVVPFYSKGSDVTENGHYFVLNAPDTVQQAEAAYLFHQVFRNDNVVIVETGNTTNPMVTAIRKYLPTVRFAQLPLTENVLLSRLDQDRSNVIVLSSADVKSLNILLPALRAVWASHPEVKIKLMGYADWLAQTSTALLNDFYKADTHVFSPFFLDTTSAAYKNAAAAFRRNFGTEMLAGTPRMAIYGLDCGLYFLQGLRQHGKAFAGEPTGYKALQNQFRMERVSNWGGLINRQMQIVHFCPDRHIELIEKP